MLHINDICAYIPDIFVTVEESLDRLEISKSQARVYKKIYGLEKIPLALDMNAAELIKRPVAELITKNNLDKRQIKFLIHTHTARVLTPFGMSAIRQVQQELDLTAATAFSISLNNCASALSAFEVAAYLLTEFDKDAKAIVVTGDKTFTPILQSIPNTSVTAEASAAVLLSRSGAGNKLLAMQMHTYGQYSGGVWQNAEVGLEFEKQYVDMLAKVIVEVVTEAKIKIEDLKIILPHNVNVISWINTAKKLNFPVKKIYLDNVKKLAHCFGADGMINYLSAKQVGLLERGDYFLMATVGLGATFAAAVFQH
jgi:3-oxoacyl-[acyl-carrier-protein] synthase-3